MLGQLNDLLSGLQDVCASVADQKLLGRYRQDGLDDRLFGINQAQAADCTGLLVLQQIQSQRLRETLRATGALP